MANVKLSTKAVGSIVKIKVNGAAKFHHRASGLAQQRL